MKWRIPVKKTVDGLVEIEASTLEHAMEEAARGAGAPRWKPSFGGVVVNENPDIIRQVYNDGQADAKHELEPWVVDIRDVKYATMIVWAKDWNEAQKFADVMIQDHYDKIVFQGNECYVDGVEGATEEWGEEYPHYRVEV